MPGRDPTNWPLATWGLAVVAAFGGGFVNWWSKIRQGNARVFNLVELVGEVVVSGLVGVGAFMALDAIEQPLGLCAAAAGICGHMGTRLLYSLERFLERKLDKLGRGT